MPILAERCSCLSTMCSDDMFLINVTDLGTEVLQWHCSDRQRTIPWCRKDRTKKKALYLEHSTRDKEISTLPTYTLFIALHPTMHVETASTPVTRFNT